MKNDESLSGLTGFNYDAVKILLDKIDYSKISNEITRQYIGPVIRRITILVVDEDDNQMFVIPLRKIPSNELYKNIRIDEIIEQLTLIYENLLPITHQYIPNLDMQAELTSSYCSNYVLGLVNNYIKEPKKEPVKLQLSSEYGEFTPPFKLSGDYITKSVQLINKYGIDISEQEVIKRYSEPQRHFHTTKHLNDVLGQIFNKYDKSFDDPFSNPMISDDDLVSMIIAGVFHDIVYDPQRKDNEEKSVEMLKYYCGPKSKYPLSMEMWNKAEEIILATKSHDKIHELISIFNNIDCSILDRSYPELLEWENQIYKEYEFAGWEQYKERRIKFLKLSLPDHPKNSDNLKKLIEFVENGSGIFIYET